MSDAPGYTVSVRALCEFAAKRGDLDRTFSPSPTANEGIAGHRTVTGKRAPGYRSEVALSASWRGLQVRGRADGYDADVGRVEEIKTFRGTLAHMPGNRRALHWAQASVYAWMLCRRDQLDAIAVALVYYDVDRDLEMPALVQRRTAEELGREFEALCDAFVDWADVERSHRDARDRSLKALQFPHPAFRAGQHAMASAVWRAVTQKRCLVAEAPTGIGKTLASLYPAMKGMAGSGVDRIFFLTARTTGRGLALDAAATIRKANPDLALRLLELTARDQACEHPDKNCNGESCPLARGFYDRLPAARLAAAERATLDRAALRSIALAHEVCPYFLGIEMARWCDVVVGDYNHWFDGHPLLAALTEENSWRTVVLVDEAHNLPDRARAMYSRRLTSDMLRDAKTGADEAIRKPLQRLTRAWNRLTAEVTGAYRVCDRRPDAFLDALKGVTTALGEAFAERPDGLSRSLVEFYFDALELNRLASSVGPHSIYDITVERGQRRGETTIGIRNLVPASFLESRHAAAHTTILFSATLTPHKFYADMLGLPPDTVRQDIPSPFTADQLTIHLVDHISTRFRHRDGSLASLVALIAEAFDRAPGNYLVFLGSHAYLQRVANLFGGQHPRIPSWAQGRRMIESERDAFLERFTPGGRGVGFAVLGGAFGEGIDLPGDRLIGAFVATLGFPPFDEVNEEQRQRLDARYGLGFEYTYLYPGIRRVVQAAGRVIRSTSDRGTLHLVDDRFAKSEVLRLLPTWWDVNNKRLAGLVER